jgi:hypothetical protein
MVLLVLIIIAVILAFFGSGWVPTIGAPSRYRVGFDVRLTPPR